MNGCYMMKGCIQSNRHNDDSIFIELFSLLKRYEAISNEKSMLAYDSDELKIMHQYIENAIDVSLQVCRDWGI